MTGRQPADAEGWARLVRGLFAELGAGQTACSWEAATASYSTVSTEELRPVASAVPSRRWGFAAGRAAASRVLAELGLEARLARGSHGEPLWPQGVVGSISHTGDWAAAVAMTATGAVASIGIDLEGAVPLEETLWSEICSPSELEELYTLPESERGTRALLLFCAKEAGYKCQFPLTGEFIGFQEAAIRHEERGDGCVFAFEPPRPALTAYELRCLARVIDGLVIAVAVAVPRRE